jgi:hypothetical protein
VFDQMQKRMIPITKASQTRGKTAQRIDARVSEGELAYRAGGTEPLEEFLQRENSNLHSLYAD